MGHMRGMCTDSSNTAPQMMMRHVTQCFPDPYFKAFDITANATSQPSVKKLHKQDTLRTREVPLGQDWVDGVGVGSACHNLHDAYNSQVGFAVQEHIMLSHLHAEAAMLLFNYALHGTAHPLTVKHAACLPTVIAQNNVQPATGCLIVSLLTLRVHSCACLGTAVANEVEDSQNQGNSAQPPAAGVSHNLFITKPSSQAQVEGMIGTPVIQNGLRMDIVGSSATTGMALHMFRFGCWDDVSHNRGLITGIDLPQSTG